jgi:hypothetical protein
MIAMQDDGIQPPAGASLELSSTEHPGQVTRVMLLHDLNFEIRLWRG